MQCIELDELGLVIPIKRVGPRWTFGRFRPARLKLRFRPEGELEVVAPLSVSMKSIHEFVMASREWIESAQEKVRSNSAQLNPRRILEGGAEIMMLGKMRTVRIVDWPESASSHRTGSGKWTAQLRATDLRLQLSTDVRSPEAIQLAIRRFSEKLVRERVEKWVDQCSHEMNLFPKKLRFGWQDTRWGSCSSLGTLSFNCRLAIAPEPTIRYVVVHELAHLKEPNHSKRFWSIVQSQCEDFRDHNHWLRKNQMMAWYL